MKVVFLLTPSFTSWAKTGHEFLPQALQHLYASNRPAEDPFVIHSVLAIVDALPSPGFGESNGAFTSGHEGLAVLATSAELSTANMFRTRNERHWRWGQRGTQPDAIISFKFCQEFTLSPMTEPQEPLPDESAHRTEPKVSDKPGFNPSSHTDERSQSYRDDSGNHDRSGSPHSDTLEPSRDTSSSADRGPEIEGVPMEEDITQDEVSNNRHRLTFAEQYDLPLAFTRFQNGRQFTMCRDIWDVTFSNRDHRWKFEPKKVDARENPSHLGITAIIESTNSKVPLTPITRSRKVVSAVGNVISQLSADEETEGALPASTELEKAIPAFIEDKGIQPGEQLRVFALITPKERGSSEPVSLEDSLRERGSHLHRVTSGGGGWGKKAGLLSVDPKLCLGPQESNWSESNIIGIGDAVQFLVAVSPKRNDAEQEEQQQLFRQGYDLAIDTARSLKAFPGEGSMFLGTTCPEDDPRHNQVSLLGHITKPRGNLAVFPGFFGMLTTKPMCIENILPPLEPAESGGPDILPSTSILGMPFASAAIGLRPAPSVHRSFRKRVFDLSSLWRKKG